MQTPDTAFGAGPGGAAPLRVLHVYKDVFPPVVGGVEKQIDALRRGLPGVVSNVVVCAREAHTSSRPVAGGTEIKAAEYGPRWLSVPIAPGLRRWVARTEADVIHVHMPNPPGELAALLAQRGRPIVATWHADIGRQARYERAYGRLVDAVFRRASAIVTGSERLAERSAPLQRHADKVRVIPYIVDTDRFRAEAVAEADREAIRGRYGTPLVVAVGRLVYYKGFEYLIEAARDLDANVLIVGEGPCGERLRRLAEPVENVHFAGQVDERELRAHLAAGDCFVLPSSSRAESFGISVAEAQAMGLPAVVTDTGTGTVEAVEHGVTGLVVPPGDPAALAAALDSVLSNPDRRAAMSSAARERAVARHALPKRAQQMRDLYLEVSTRASA